MFSFIKKATVTGVTSDKEEKERRKRDKKDRKEKQKRERASMSAEELLRLDEVGSRNRINITDFAEEASSPTLLEVSSPLLNFGSV